MILYGFKICPSVEFINILISDKKPLQSMIAREMINIREKPDWYAGIVPTGKVPALRVDKTVLFESSVIAKYLDQISGESIQPSDPLLLARNEAWMSWCDGLLMDGYLMSLAKDKVVFEEKWHSIQSRFEKLEAEVSGPFFNGESFSLIDFKYAPQFKRFDRLTKLFKVPSPMEPFPKISEWSTALLSHPSVMEGFASDFDKELAEMLEYKKASYVLSMNKEAKSAERTVIPPKNNGSQK